MIVVQNINFIWMSSSYIWDSLYLVFQEPGKLGWSDHWFKCLIMVNFLVKLIWKPSIELRRLGPRITYFLLHRLKHCKSGLFVCLIITCEQLERCAPNFEWTRLPQGFAPIFDFNFKLLLYLKNQTITNKVADLLNFLWNYKRH